MGKLIAAYCVRQFLDNAAAQGFLQNVQQHVLIQVVYQPVQKFERKLAPNYRGDCESVITALRKPVQAPADDLTSDDIENAGNGAEEGVSVDAGVEITAAVEVAMRRLFGEPNLSLLR